MPSVSEYALILYAFSFKTLLKAHNKRTIKQKKEKSISSIEQIIERGMERKATNQKNESKQQMCVVPAYFSCIHVSKIIENINTLEQELQDFQIGHKGHHGHSNHTCCLKENRIKNGFLQWIYTFKLRFRNSNLPPLNWTDWGKSPALGRLSGRVQIRSVRVQSHSLVTLFQEY